MRDVSTLPAGRDDLVPNDDTCVLASEVVRREVCWFGWFKTTLGRALNMNPQRGEKLTRS